MLRRGARGHTSYAVAAVTAGAGAAVRCACRGFAEFAGMPSLDRGAGRLCSRRRGRRANVTKIGTPSYFVEGVAEL